MSDSSDIDAIIESFGDHNVWLPDPDDLTVWQEVFDSADSEPQSIVVDDKVYQLRPLGINVGHIVDYYDRKKAGEDE